MRYYILFVKRGGDIIKDFDFCVTRASDKNISSYYDRNWQDSVPMDSESLFDEHLHGCRTLKVSGKDINNNYIEFEVNIKFSSDDDFDYFSSDSCIHDGTLMFVKDCCDRVISKICTGNTYPLVGLPPRNGSKIEYTVGRFVVLNEYGEFGTEEKPWLRERTTVILPIKYRDRK